MSICELTNCTNSYTVLSSSFSGLPWNLVTDPATCLAALENRVNWSLFILCTSNDLGSVVANKSSASPCVSLLLMAAADCLCGGGRRGELVGVLGGWPNTMLTESAARFDTLCCDVCTACRCLASSPCLYSCWSAGVLQLCHDFRSDLRSDLRARRSHALIHWLHDVFLVNALVSASVGSSVGSEASHLKENLTGITFVFSLIARC